MISPLLSFLSFSTSITSFSFFTKLEIMIAIQFYESHLFCIHKKAPEKFRENFNSTHVPLIHNFLHHF